MRLTLRILASVSMALSALALGLLAWTWQAKLPGSSVQALLAGPLGVLAFVRTHIVDERIVRHRGSLRRT